jgi:hypothetical protein
MEENQSCVEICNWHPWTWPTDPYLYKKKEYHASYFPTKYEINLSKIKACMGKSVQIYFKIITSQDWCTCEIWEGQEPMGCEVISQKRRAPLLSSY